MQAIKDIIESEVKSSEQGIPFLTFLDLLDSAQYLLTTLTNSPFHDYVKASLLGTESNIKELKERLKECEALNKEINSLIELEKTLKLEIINGDYENKLEQVSQLKNSIEQLEAKKDAFQKIDVVALENIIEELEDKNNKDFSRLIKLAVGVNNQLEKFDDLIEKDIALQTLRKNHENIQKKEYLLEYIITDDLKQLGAIHNGIEQKVFDYNLLVTKLDQIQRDLKEVDQTHEKNVRVWKTHIEMNNSSIKSFSNLGYDSSIVNELSAEISNKLCQLDKEISNIIKVRDNLTIGRISITSKFNNQT